ncbi:hypothetical protein SDC9_42300 [bioreactor metagenome]|uniref:Uncharacterized protein n=1 Tax=bioreactor metagenome TaxID=1076179 RepID=A0A644VXD6_9ZZZZ|nr:hypothetical protein [Paludibacter sp.]
MSKLSSLISLIHSLTKSERKKVSSFLNMDKNTADYAILYKVIDEKSTDNQQQIKTEFIKLRPNAAFNTAINYLFDNLLLILNQLRINQDSYYALFNLLMNTKVLYEKSLYQECFLLLTKIQNEAVKYENFTILLIAQKMELDYLLSLDFPDTTEQELLNKQYKINETLKKIRKINEHASLYELLKHRILHKGPVRSNKQKQEMNDLVVSEMSIVSSSGFENFEIQKNHKLFQSNYLINVGDYKSALNSYYELNNIFEQNMHLLSNPPMYYLNTIEGVLESLRTIRNYEGMTYFINQLSKLETTSVHFKFQIDCVIFLYSLLPFVDTGKFTDAFKMIEKHKESIIDKTNLLSTEKQIQILLYTAIVYLGTGEPHKARKIITRITQSERKVFSLPLFRTIRLVNLMVLYEQKEFDYMDFEIRSVKREIQNNEKSYQLEQVILKFLSKTPEELTEQKRLLLWQKLKPQIEELQNNKFEMQLLHVFNFIAWIESKVFKVPLHKVLKE